MKKKILIISISAAIFLVVASFSSVIGTNNISSSQKVGSPLFSIRTQRSLQKDGGQFVQSNYLGKGLTIHLFMTAKPSYAAAIDRTIKLLNQNPVFFAKFLETICSNPRVISILQDNGISMTEFKAHLNLMKNNPSIFIDDIRSVESRLNVNELNKPFPLGLNTTNPFACVITVIALLPVVLIIGLIVVLFTLRILACLNLEEVMQNIFDQILQELFPPGYNI